MNDFNRRLYAVLQRMSAKERYKRKKTTTKTTTTTTTRLHKAAASTTTPRALPPLPSPSPTDEQQTANGSSQSRETSAERLICDAEALFSHSAETCDQIAQFIENSKQQVVDTIPTTTTAAEHHHHRQQHQSSQPNDTSIAQLREEINDDYKRLANNLQKDATTYKELANLLRHGKPDETNEQQQQLQRERESDQTELNAADRR